MSNERDTHFAGFAALLLTELDNAIKESSHLDETEQEFAQKLGIILAQRAYDLVRHALYCDNLDAIYHGHATPLYEQGITKAIGNIPDLAEWPKA